MTVATSPRLAYPTTVALAREDESFSKLLKGEVLLTTRPHTAWGAAVTAQMHLPINRAIAWEQLTNYPRWVQYLPALSRSEVRQQVGTSKRLYQVASKNFLLFTAQVEIYLNVTEVLHQRIQFRMESGHFNDFSADLKLQDYANGTLLTYTVQATPSIPMPSLFIQQAIQLDLPANMRNMRQVLCR
jgi:hypothetical protein